MEWISVEEKLPEVQEAGNSYIPGLKESVECLVITKFGEMHIAKYTIDYDDEAKMISKYWNMEGVDVVDHVTHWMQLPEPPK